MSKLHNVRGRITYISSHAKQENLYAVYETTDRSYWTELARYNQQEFLKSGTEGKCIEARELIIALPESFPNLYQPNKLLQLFTNRFKEKYGVECVSALHHNKRKTNYHCHPADYKLPLPSDCLGLNVGVDIVPFMFTGSFPSYLEEQERSQTQVTVNGSRRRFTQAEYRPVLS